MHSLKNTAEGNFFRFPSFAGAIKTFSKKFYQHFVYDDDNNDNFFIYPLKTLFIGIQNIFPLIDLKSREKRGRDGNNCKVAHLGSINWKAFGPFDSKERENIST